MLNWDEFHEDETPVAEQPAKATPALPPNRSRLSRLMPTQ